VVGLDVVGFDVCSHPPYLALLKDDLNLLFLFNLIFGSFRLFIEDV